MHARLKSTVVSAVVDTAPVMLWVPPVPDTGADPAKRKKKKSRGKKKRSGATGKKGKKEVTKATPPPPPTLGEENFPTLQDKTVEWDTSSDVEAKGPQRRGSNSSSSSTSTSEEDDSEDEEERIAKEDYLEDEKEGPKSFKAMSDGASTATTTSSSMESVPKKTLPGVGYAAALMGKSNPRPDSEGQVSKVPVALVAPKPDVSKVPEDQPVSASLAPKSESWGGRRSFADMLRISQESPTAS